MSEYITLSEKDQDLLRALLKLARSPLSEEAEKEMITFFRDLYKSDFRHRYSTFQSTIKQIRDSVDMDLDQLLANIAHILKAIQTDKDIEEIINGNDTKESRDLKNTVNGLQKLFDHISLEVSRVNDHEDLLQSVEDLKVSLKESRDKLDLSTRRLESVQTEMIAVLSIFAVVVLAFNGGFTLFGEAFKSVNEAPIQKTLAVLTCSLLLLGDLIFILIYSISRLTGKSLLSLSADKSQGNWFKRVIHELPYIFWYNVVCILLFLVCVLWILAPEIILLINKYRP